MEKGIQNRSLHRKISECLITVLSGKIKSVVKLKLLDPQGISVEGIYFGEAEDFVNFIREKDSISVTYYPEINRFRGRESLQIIIQNYC